MLNRGTVYLVDASGTRYPLGGTVSETQGRLGYRRRRPGRRTHPLADLFPDGPELSRAQAWKPTVSP